MNSWVDKDIQCIEIDYSKKANYYLMILILVMMIGYIFLKFIGD